jgi:hypothetical protein
MKGTEIAMRRRHQGDGNDQHDRASVASGDPDRAGGLDRAGGQAGGPDDAEDEPEASIEREHAPGKVDEPIDLGSVDRGLMWSRLALTQTQLAELVGLSPRQVSRWVQNGLLVPSSHNADRFNGDAVEVAILMQRAVAHGYRPRRAAQLARLALARQMGREGQFAVPTPDDVREKLIAAQTAIAVALDILFAPVGPGARGGR